VQQVTGKSTLQLYSPEGKLLLKQAFIGESNVDVSALPQGLYVVKNNYRKGHLYKKDSEDVIEL